MGNEIFEKLVKMNALEYIKRLHLTDSLDGCINYILFTEGVYWWSVKWAQVSLQTRTKSLVNIETLACLFLRPRNIVSLARKWCFLPEKKSSPGERETVEHEQETRAASLEGKRGPSRYSKCTKLLEDGSFIFPRIDFSKCIKFRFCIKKNPINLAVLCHEWINTFHLTGC